MYTSRAAFFVARDFYRHSLKKALAMPMSMAERLTVAATANSLDKALIPGLVDN